MLHICPVRHKSDEKMKETIMMKAAVSDRRRGRTKNVLLAAVLCSALTAGTLSSVNAFAAAKSADAREETEAMAAGTDVVFSTDYPGVSVKPGDSSTFSLYMTNDGDTQDDLTLSAEDLPKGWTGSFKGSASEVSMVHVQAGQTKDDSPSLSYQLTVPDDAKEGDYTITLKAEGRDTDAELPLTVKVDKNETGAASGEFTAEYPEQQGSTSTDFSFSTTLKNNGAENATYALAAANVPDGWNVTFTPSGASAQAASVPVDAGSSASVTVDVTPSEDAKQGDYEIDCTASAGSETLTLPLTVTITGTYGMTLTTPDGNLSAKAYAGEGKKVTLEVQNTGNVPLKNVQLTSQASTDWTVEFDNSTIDSIDAGASKEVTATITPAKDAIIGDYIAVITARNDESSSEADIRVSVQNHTAWGIVAVVIIAALIAGLLAIIRKFGRR